MSDVERERDYYRSQCNELGARLMRMQKELTHARREARRSYTTAILTSEAFRLGSLSLNEINGRFLRIILDTMSVDIAVILEYQSDIGGFIIRDRIGVSNGLDGNIHLQVPPPEFMAVNSRSTPNDFIDCLRQMMNVPYLLWAFNSNAGFALLVGNAGEDQHLHRMFEDGDRQSIEGALNAYIDVTARKQAEMALQKAHDELDRRVKERTADLSRANELLKAEIAERKRTEDDLRISENRFQEVAENSQEWIWEMDANGLYIYVSPAVEKILGYATDEIMGKKHFYDLLHPEEVVIIKENAFKTFAERKRFREFSNRKLHKNGDTVWLSTSGVPILDANGDLLGYRGSDIDITDRKHVEEERARLEEQLRQAQKMEAIGQLAGGVAHDFNNLLTGIIGNLALAQRKSPQDIRQYLIRARCEANRSAELVQQLLAFSRKSRPEFNLIDFNQIVNDTYNLARQSINRRIGMEMNLGHKLPPIRADASQLSSVLMNLCVNARDAIEEAMYGQTCPELHDEPFLIKIETESVIVTQEYCRERPDARLGRFVVLSVSDSGVGMDQETYRHLFDPFFTTKEVGKGTGLGLASAYGIVKQHDGWIDVYSALCKGTTFKIFLPIAEGQIKADTDELTEDIPGGKEGILIIDDEETIRNFAREALEQYGYTVHLASNGKEGLNLYLKNRDSISLIVLDVSMPHLSGTETLEKLRFMNSDTKVIIISGYPKTRIEKFLERFGVAAYMAKPFGPDELARTVRRILDGTE